MKKLITYIILFCSLQCAGQNNMGNSWIIVDHDWAYSRKDSISQDYTHNYVFGEPVHTYTGKWVVPAVNFIYFTFPDSITVLQLPSATDSIITPPYHSILTH